MCNLDTLGYLNWGRLPSHGRVERPLKKTGR